ncbi:MAG: PfkB family carbohydrate kinase [Ferruginibacter sp.]
MRSINFSELFNSFKNLKVGVIGDMMLDTYWWGKVDRISPEAPVPIVTVTKREQRIGGAGNVALNLAAFGARVDALGMIGNDEDGAQLTKMLNEKNISAYFLAESNKRPTTNKIRIISRNQHMMRLDAEITEPLSKEEEIEVLNSFSNYLLQIKPDIVIFEDYNKGVLTPKVIGDAITMCKQNNVLIAVDPKRKNFFCYSGADIFKPNLQEAKDSLNIIVDDLDEVDLKNIHDRLKKELNHDISFITLSEKGVFYNNSEESKIIPTHIRKIADVSGAGDTVIAVASLVYASTKDVKLMAEVSNIAGGLVCEEVGTVAINKEKLIEECDLLL